MALTLCLLLLLVGMYVQGNKGSVFIHTRDSSA
jgi:hypothetical protein